MLIPASSEKYQPVSGIAESIVAHYNVRIIPVRSEPMPLKILLTFGAIGITTLAVLGGGHPSAQMLLPLGDGKISPAPKAGYMYSCQTAFRGGGAHRDGEWIVNGMWDPSKKVHVGGDERWPQATLSITIDDDHRTISGNGLPKSHSTGTFPITPSDPAYQFDRNPNSLQPQSVRLTLPRIPTVGSAPQCVSMGPIGVALTGVTIFNGLDAGGRDAVAHEIQDQCGGHPERRGQYHYHNLSACIAEVPEVSGHSALVGYVVDGFGLYGQKGETGKELTNTDLDECHGHSHEVVWDGTRRSLYHYHATHEYPYTVGCFRGSVVQTPGRQPGEPRGFSDRPDRPPFPPGPPPPRRSPGPPPFPPE